MPIDTLAMARTALRLAPDAKLVTFGSQSTYGVLDDDERVLDDGTGEPVAVRTREVMVAANTFTGLVDGSAMIVGGVSYTVRGRPRPRENGDLWAIALARVS